MTNEEKSKIQDGIVDSLPTPVHGLLQLAPRLGKSRIAIKIMKEQKPKTILWVTPTTKLRDTDIPNEYATWKAKNYLKRSTIICYGSMASTKGHFDLIILDEYQDLTEGNSLPLFTGQITYNNIIGLSGTHPKHEEKNILYRRLNLKPLANLDIEEAVGRGIIADYRINVVEVKMESQEKLYEGGNAKNRFFQTESSRYEYMSRMVQKAFGRADFKWKILDRMRFIHNSKSKEKAAKWLMDNLQGRRMIFCGGIDLAERLCEYTFHSKTDDKHMNAFINEEIEKIACVNAGGVGFTYRNVQNFIIGQADSDKKGLTTQKITRSMLEQGDDYVAQIWILSLIDTQDQKWVESTLASFDMSKVSFVRFDNLVNENVKL